MPQRILIIGCPGSGKSTFARRLSAQTGLPIVHLDALYWLPGWVERSREDFDALLQDELEKPCWIIDGNYTRTLAMRLEKCDAVIWLDYGRLNCLTGVLKRILTHLGRVRPDMGAGCPERFDAEFLRYVWSFKKNNDAKIADRIAHAPQAAVLRASSRRELNRRLDAFLAEK